MDEKRAYFLGSFSPLHQGHLAIVHHYEKFLGNEVTFVMTRNNIDKGSVGEEDLEKRKLQFLDLNRKCEVVNARTFLGTICELRDRIGFRIPPPVDILVGVDTWNRIHESRCYFDSIKETERVLHQLYLLARFIVFPRDDIKPNLSKKPVRVLVSKKLFKPIDISSSEIRRENV